VERRQAQRVRLEDRIRAQHLIGEAKRLVRVAESKPRSWKTVFATNPLRSPPHARTAWSSTPRCWRLLLEDFQVRYTFGTAPLQQYLVELPDGRVHALSVAWDTRPQDAGGQRWFHLYPNEQIGPRDELHWSARAQNWHLMWADCHSTHVRDGYAPDTDTFEATYAEAAVGCEACHGSGK
jgi:hypothetical protein